MTRKQHFQSVSAAAIIALILASVTYCAGGAAPARRSRAASRAPAPPASSGGLANSPWPKEGHDPGNTNRTSLRGPIHGRVVWTRHLAWRGGVHLSMPAVDGAGNIYIGSIDGALYSLSPARKIRWMYQTAGWMGDTVLPANGTVYAADLGGTLYALAASNGKLLWNFHIRPGGNPASYVQTLGSPGLGGDGTVYLGAILYDLPEVEAPSSLLYAVTPGGKLKWSLSVQGKFEGVAVRPGPGRIDVATSERLYALDAKGEAIWTSLLGSLEPPVIGMNGELLILPIQPGHPGAPSMSPRELYAIGARGAVLWHVPLMTRQAQLAQKPGYGTAFFRPTLGWHGVIYLGSSDGLWVLDMSGRLRAHAFPGKIVTSPLVDGKGHLYLDIAAQSSPSRPTLYALTEGRKIMWKIGGAVPVAIGPGRRLYAVVDTAARLDAIE
ncbi:MAG TPA: PQQ-binding-like beta-propeller repeat protein [Armatimonadota bacterium]|nr:PQQ-binding-like beta-propeller repeat protein [Armatimonadota bacterium]